ncbi:MAG TPA: SEC-C metal-binding domain-containing protein [Kofleriaceae bacterium]|nr:SEC-C metal-binding domain-containing protein [Kofleriaceae bacterium]
MGAARDDDQVDDERMAALMEALAEAAEKLARREPVQLPAVQPAEAATLARALHDEMDRGVETRDAAIAGSGHRLACGRGCSACCEIVIMTYEPEAQAVARWLARPEQRAARMHFAEAYPGWRAAAGDLADRARAGAASGDPAEVGEAAAEAARRHVLCAFNRGGDCTIYDVRPNLCRACHALDTAAHCVADNPEGERPTVMHFAPIDDFLARIRPLQAAAHAALRGHAPPEPLCDAVHRLLSASSRAVGRNEPCPCGSGAKYKRCCGAR